MNSSTLVQRKLIRERSCGQAGNRNGKLLLSDSRCRSSGRIDTRKAPAGIEPHGKDQYHEQLVM
jgi:hypothetical protein